MQGYLRIGETIAPLALSKGPRLADGRLASLEADWLDIGGQRWPIAYARDGDRLWVHLGGQIHELVWVDPIVFHEAAAAGGGNNVVAAPMPGVVVRLIATEGQDVTEGEPLLVIESMKLETTLRAPADGILALHVAAGQGFDRGAPLATITPKD